MKNTFGGIIIGLILGIFGTQFLFLLLKWTKTVNWSWWLVLVPLWFYLGVCLLLFLVGIILIVWKTKK